ncbi:hypothetical protein V1477_021300 [Vespula maculifrons]|uniref:Uncharacterized protein n=1 Tax=Vespula maculifrons TaxID=7453 RepID=A0ABD2AGR7_VESMC
MSECELVRLGSSSCFLLLDIAEAYIEYRPISKRDSKHKLIKKSHRIKINIIVKDRSTATLAVVHC